MVQRADLEQYRTSNQDLSTLVVRELEGFFATLDVARPEAARNALLEFLPLLVEVYGQSSAAIAADWYEKTTGTARGTTLAASVTAERVQAGIRYAADGLFHENPSATLGLLRVATDKWVKQPGRDTVAWNADRDGRMWARVPTGKKTCAFCMVLASRDAVYLSEKSAKYGSDGEKYHGECDCVPTPLDSWDDYPEGYDPEGMYEIYNEAANEAGTRSDIKTIAAVMRRQHPDLLRDGVYDPLLL
ncbi:VG15 protein [Zhihengliuella flava]|uniref:Uncharacterized protein n=1 Tax=Zhihengliuella flava TaxID=1285193 RepID=A0A931D6Y4_9MICC|nr:hypothetical protein [Zhihengliuella flava]MBG6083247.1 hypothetical protein [Zhihengliuella flava]